MKKILNFFKSKIRTSVVVFACIGIVIAYGFGYHYRFLYNTGTSMVPTYYDHQWLLMKKIKPNTEINRLDIVAVRSAGTGELFIKRVIGLPGDSLEVLDGNIFVNGRHQVDPYGHGKISFLMVDDNDRIMKVNFVSQKEMVVPAGHIWVIGDSRNESLFGLFPLKDVSGVIVW